jgi:hypothetical protein
MVVARQPERFRLVSDEGLVRAVAAREGGHADTPAAITRVLRTGEDPP